MRTFLKRLFLCLFFQIPWNPTRDTYIRRLIGTSREEGYYLLRFLHRSLSLEGDVCEFGIAQGATSTLLASEMMDSQKKIWLFDSFEGLPKPHAKDVLIDDILNLGSMDKYQGRMKCAPSQVLKRMDKLGFPRERIEIVPGFIEETIQGQKIPKRVCFAYIDFDFYQPILTALEYLAEHLTVGGYVLVDDYGFFSQGAKTAVDEFMQKNRGRMQWVKPHPFVKQKTCFCVLKKVKDYEPSQNPAQRYAEPASR
jgi:O-methyltransferase